MTGKRHMTPEEVVKARCASAVRWASEAAMGDYIGMPVDALNAIRLAKEDLEVAEARLISLVTQHAEQR
jgi:hypothetical protein